MRISVVGARYAHALADVVFLPGSPIKAEEVVQQLRTVEGIIAGSPELRSVLITPAITIARKRAVVGKLLSEAGISPVLRNFLFVIIDHQRITELPSIRAAFEGVVDEKLGVVRAEVTSAELLNENQTRALETALNQLSGKRVSMKTSVDSGLIGGVVARIGSTVYDGSVRGQLEGMRRKLSSESA